MTDGPVPSSIAMKAVLLLVLAACTSAGVLAAEPAEKNAGLLYLRACLALPEAKDPYKDKMAYRLEIVAARALPAVFGHEPGAKEVEDRAALYKRSTALLHRAASLPRCRFGIDRSSWTTAAIDHLTPMRRLARGTTTYGKYLEYKKKPLDALMVYLDQVRLGYHLTQEPDVIHSLAGAAIAHIGIANLRSQLARAPDEKTAALIFTELAKLPDSPLDLAGVLDAERITNARLFAKELTAAVKKGGREGLTKALDGMVSDDALKALKLPEDKEQLEDFVQLWSKEYNLAMMELAAAAKGACHKAMPRVKSLQAAIEKRDRGRNPLIACLAAFDTLKRNEGRQEVYVRTAKLLAASCLEKARTGKYPESLEGLKKHFPKGLPKDPFTGEDFTYRLEDGMPMVASAGDKTRKVKSGRTKLSFGLAEIKAKEAKWALNWQKYWKEAQESDKDQ